MLELFKKLTLEKIIFERKRFVYVNSKRTQPKDFLIIKNLMLRTAQIEIRVEDHLLDLLILKSRSIKFYNLHFLSIPFEVNISVKEVLEDIDMTLDENINYQNFQFFKELGK